MANKKKVPEHIKEFYDKDKKVRKLLATTRAVHTEAYMKGLDTIKDEAGQVDYDKLDNVKIQDQFLDKMIDHYLTNAVDKLGLKKKPKDELDQDIILKRYIGVTKGELKRILRGRKSGYNQKYHEDIRDQLVEKQGNELAPLRHGHFEEEHVGDVVKYTGVGEYVDEDKLDIKHAADILDRHKAHRGKLTLEHIANLASTSEDKGGWGSTVYLSKKAKDELKKKD